MPLSIIIELEHEFPLSRQHFGRQAQGWFFESLKKINPEIADCFHNAQPYTISSPTPENFDDIVNSGKKKFSAVRLTILDDSFRDFFLFNFLPNLDNHFPLLWMDFKISSYSYSKNVHNLAGFKSYAELSCDYSHNYSRSVMLKFISPTLFRNGDIDIPLPDPVNVYRNLLHSWNAFSPKVFAIEDDWLYFAKNAIVVNRIDELKTERISLAGGQRGAVTGFTGCVEYSLISKKKLSRLFQDYYSQGASIFNTLSAFSFFCGVGARTTIGMGQTIPEIKI